MQTIMQTIGILLQPSLAALAVGRFRAAPLRADGARRIERQLTEPTTWTDAIEAVGVPHCEIGRVIRTRDGAPLDPGEATRDATTVIVEGPARLPLDPPKLLCDSHLGKLARTLRILGIDTLWRPDWERQDLLELAATERRTILSRARALLKQREIERAQLIRANDPLAQAEEVLARWSLDAPGLPFGRCSVCNGLLEPVERTRIEARIPPKTARWLDEYYLCAGCDRLYWHGTHVMSLRRRLAPLLRRPEETPDPSEAP